MSNRRKPRPTLSPVALLEAALPRCECRHSYEPDGRCTSEATARVSVLCAEDGCANAAAVYLVCGHCLTLWRRESARKGEELRVRPLR